MKTDIVLKVGQQLSITPQLQQAIRLLQLSNIELHHEINQFMAHNPLIETLPSDDDSFDELDAQTYELPMHSKTSHDYSSAIEKMTSFSLSLREHLFWQMQFFPFHDEERIIATAIIDGIDDDGFLQTHLEDILTLLEPKMTISMMDIESVLLKIQQFEPAGVAARSLEECLALQLKQLPSTTPWHHQAQLLITHYLLLLGKHDYATLKRRLKLNQDELSEVIRLVQKLNPRPGNQIGEPNTEYIIPDVIAWKNQHKWKTKLYSQVSSTLTINTRYAQWIQDRKNSNASLRQQLQEAKWFIRSIESRQMHILSVTDFIVNYQNDFFEQGTEHLKSLTLQEVADSLNIHESTVSRIVSKKYVHTPKGIFELKYFFSNPIVKSDNVYYSGTAVRALIRKLIAQEDSKKPLSDSKIVDLLHKHGIELARRTVTKYREEMNILPSFERKTFT